MDLSIFLHPVNASFNSEDFTSAQLGSVTDFNPELSEEPGRRGSKIAILGVPDGRGAVDNNGCSKAPHIIRDYLYKLGKPVERCTVSDFGNIEPGDSPDDTRYAVSSTVATLIKNGYAVILLGGGQDITYANYAAYGQLEQTVDLVSVDSKFDLGTLEGDLDSSNYLSKIIAHQPNYLFNHTNIGYQNYFTDPDSMDLMDRLYFDHYRLGLVQEDLEQVEPMVRNADMLSFDISAVRFSDAPGSSNASPHGFYGEQACAICRYAGLSDKLTSVGFYELNPELDERGQTAHLTAQLVWHFLHGYFHRKHDFPVADRSDYTKYTVALKEGTFELVFYKSNLSERWWMEVPFPTKKDTKYKRHMMIPCSYQDYETSLKDEMPDRWWKAYQKL